MTMIQTGWPGVTLSPLTTPAPLNPPFEWLCIDIETAAEVRPEQVHAWTRMVFSPSDSWKDETVGRRYREAVESWKTKAALLDTSPIVVVAIKTPAETRVLHDLYQHAPRSESGALIESFPDEKAMMTALAVLLETRTDPSTILCGHNLARFDAPKIRRSMVAHGVRLPSILVSRDAQIYDTMQQWARSFSLSGSAFVSLDVVLESLGLPSHKEACDGSRVGSLIEAGEHDTVLKYSFLDVAAETDCFLRMTGRA
ncbi:MAG: hypothetical protein JW741_12015 [Sedimentisphaerales bacterium]|nr:hypothetical protein [Sedimentisphaerales bacterium]